MNMLTSVAIIKPIKAMNRYLPIEVRSVFVVYPISAITPNVPAVIKNTVAIDDAV